MMARRSLLRVVAGGALFSLTGCSSRSASYRFRMTVEVETPQGIKTGSSVMEVRVARGMAIGDQSGISSGIFGEAVVVDLPSGPLFILLQIPDAGPPLQEIVPDALLAMSSDTSESADEVMTNTAKLGSTWFGSYKAELPRTRDNGSQASNNNWPMMVRFRDINDPKSVERVDPEAVGVKRILLETTGDDVTVGIEKRLGWFKNEGMTLDPSGGIDFSGNASLAKKIRQRDFSTEIGK